MVTLLLLVIIAILLNGSAKFLGAVGAIAGASLGIGILTYAAVHYELSGWTVVVLISISLFALIVYGVWDEIEKKRTKEKIEADSWEQIRATMVAAGQTEDEFLGKFPDWRKRKDAWHRKNKGKTNQA